MVPPWTPPPPSDAVPSDDAGDAPEGAEQPEGNGAARPSPTAPPARFGAARRSLGDYARTGGERSLRRGLGSYVSRGYGGSGTATRRFGGTAKTARVLGGALASVAEGQPAAPGSPLDPTLLAGRSAREVMDAVVNAVRPVDGTQDSEAARAAIQDALSELLTRFPGADLLNLDAEQRSFAIERYTAADVFRRIQLDLGRTIMEKAPSATAALSRLKQVREYVKEVVAASFRKLRGAGQTLTSGRVGGVVRDALRETFVVFEGYAR